MPPRRGSTGRGGTTSPSASRTIRGVCTLVLRRAGTGASAGHRSPCRARRRRRRPRPSAAPRACAPCRVSVWSLPDSATCRRSTSPCSRGRRGSGSTARGRHRTRGACLRIVRIGFLAGGSAVGGTKPNTSSMYASARRSARARLAAHPGDELREDEGDDELPLVVRQVREVDDRRSAAPSGVEQQRLDVERGARSLHAAKDGEAMSPLSRIASSVRSFAGKNCVDVEHAELSQRRGAGSRRSACPGRGLGPRARHARRGWRAARARGWRAGRPSIPTSPSRPVTVPSISSRSVSASVVPRHAGGARSEPTTFERHSGARSRRVDRHVGGVAELLQSRRLDPGRSRPSRQRVAVCAA